MLTEHEARELLRQAGETIEVRGAAPIIDGKPRRPWALVGAAGVAASLVLAAFVGLGQDPGGPDDGGSANPGPTDGVPAGSVPSVFAHTRASATDLLEGLGYRVDVRREDTCVQAGRVVGTEPSTGTPVDEGGTVTLLVAYQGPTTDCIGFFPQAWAFLDFATGRGPAPEFADEVTLVVDGGGPRTLSGAEAAQGDWGDPSALTALRAAAAEVRGVNGDFSVPTLGVSEGTPPDQRCGVARPAVFGQREGMSLTVDIPVDGAVSCPTTVTLYRTGGRVDGVMTWTERGVAEPARAPVPDVVGMTLEEARASVTAAGYTARVEENPTCAPRRGVVTEQAPTEQMLREDAEDDPGVPSHVTLVVEVPHPTRDCAGLRAAADGLVRFASGGTPPRWAPRVHLLLGYTPYSTLTPEQADDPTSWSMCSGVAPSECEASVLALLADGGVGQAEYAPVDECELIDRGGLPSGLVEQDQVELYPLRPGDCTTQWQMTLWIDDEGRLEAVNLLVHPDRAPL